MRYKTLYFALSALFLIPGVFALIFWGLRPSIDFTGGTLWEIKVETLKGDETQKIEESLVGSGVDVSSVQSSGENRFLIRTKPLDASQKSQALESLRAKLGEVEELRFETVGPTLGRELLVKTFIAIGLAALLIFLYIGSRFRSLMYGGSAILAMFHDTLILLGTFAVLGRFLNVEVDTLFVTAVLTTLSFSVHDTIVVYDRIRELSRKFPKLKFEDLINQAVGETLTRSLNNSLTIIFMLTALFLLGGETIKWFVFALLVGTISGTYSSTFTAAPLLVVWNRLKTRNRKS